MIPTLSSILILNLCWHAINIFGDKLGSTTNYGKDPKNPPCNEALNLFMTSATATHACPPEMA
jgi:hypothetical protein